MSPPRRRRDRRDSGGRDWGRGWGFGSGYNPWMYPPPKYNYNPFVPPLYYPRPYVRLGPLVLGAKKQNMGAGQSTGTTVAANVPMHTDLPAALYSQTMEALAPAANKALATATHLCSLSGESVQGLLGCSRKKVAAGSSSSVFSVDCTDRAFVSPVRIVVAAPGPDGQLKSSELEACITVPAEALQSEEGLRAMLNYLRDCHQRISVLAKEPSDGDPGDIYVASTVDGCYRPLQYDFRSIMQPQGYDKATGRRGMSLLVISPFALNALMKGRAPSASAFAPAKIDASALVDALTGPSSKLGRATVVNVTTATTTPAAGASAPWCQYVAPPLVRSAVCIQGTRCGHARCEKTWSPAPRFIGQSEAHYCVDETTCVHGDVCQVQREMRRRMNAGHLCPSGSTCSHPWCIQDRTARVRPMRQDAAASVSAAAPAATATTAASAAPVALGEKFCLDATKCVHAGAQALVCAERRVVYTHSATTATAPTAMATAGPGGKKPRKYYSEEDEACEHKAVHTKAGASSLSSPAASVPSSPSTTAQQAAIKTGCDTCGKHNQRKKKNPGDKDPYEVEGKHPHTVSDKAMRTMLTGSHLAALAGIAPACAAGDMVVVQMPACHEQIKTATRMKIVSAANYQSHMNGALQTKASPGWAAGKCIAAGTVDHTSGKVVYEVSDGVLLQGAGDKHFVVFSNAAKSPASCSCDACR